MKRVFGLVRLIEETFPALLIGTLTLIVAVDVLGRYLLNHPVKGFGELATLMFVWQVFVGASAALRRGLHVNVDLFVVRLPSRIRAAIGAIVNMGLVIMTAAVMSMGWEYAFQAKTQRIQTLDLPYTVALLAVPVSGFLMCFHLLRNTVHAVRGLFANRYEPVQEGFEGTGALVAESGRREEKST